MAGPARRYGAKEEGPLDAHVTAVLCVIACGVTLMSWMGKDVSPFYLTEQAFWAQPWRMVTCVFPHANFRVEGFLAFFHIVFNVMMILRYGRLIELRYHAALTALFYFSVALGSMTAQYALDAGGAGLSGVGYGVFGFLWVAGKRSRDFEGALDYGAVVTFVGWFFFCIATTRFGALRIANVAHGMGCVLGALIALYATARTPTTRSFFGASTLLLIAGCVALAAHRDIVPPWMRGVL